MSGQMRRLKVRVVDPWIWEAFVIKGDRPIRYGAIYIDFINRIIHYTDDEVVVKLVKEFLKRGYFELIEEAENKA